MTTALPYEAYHNLLLGLYVQDDASDAVNAVYEVRTLLGREITELETWFPRWEDQVHEVFLADDAYSLAVRENLHTVLTDLVEGASAELLDAAGRLVAGFEPEIKLGFGRVAGTLLTATMLACREVNGAVGAVLLVLGDGDGEVERIIRLRVDDSGRRVPQRLHEISASILAACCAV
jgi:hypothetical protein